MKMTSLKPWLSAFAVTSASFIFQTPVHAQSCADGADCDPGYTCRTETYQSCWGSGTCSEDGGCTMEESHCEDVVSSYCTNATCDADADCPDHMACQQQTNWVCEGGMSGSAGAGGAAGSPGPDGGWEEPSCEELPADSICIPRHQLPCEVASDCGGGFDCVESTYWQCGGAGMGGSGGGAGTGVGGAPAQDAGSPDEEGLPGPDGGSDYECEEVPSGTSYCQLQDLPCETNADCPSGLECGEQYSYPPCEPSMGGAGGTAGGAGGAGSGADVDGGGSWDCPDPVVQQRCMPSSYEGGGGTGGMGSAGSGGGSGEADAGVEEPEGGSGEAGMGGAAGNPDDDGGSDEKPNHGKKRGWLKKLFGCSTTGATTSEGGMSWLVLGLAAFALRRRTRKA